MLINPTAPTIEIDQIQIYIPDVNVDRARIWCAAKLSQHQHMFHVFMTAKMVGMPNQQLCMGNEDENKFLLITVSESYNSYTELTAAPSKKIGIWTRPSINLRAHRPITPPSLLQLLALDLTQGTSNGDAAGQTRARDFFHEAQGAGFVFPVGDV